MLHGTIITAIYYDAGQGYHYIKRFEPEANGKVQTFSGDNEDNKLILVTTDTYPRLRVRFPESERRQKTEEEIDVHEFIAVKSVRARGKRLANTEIKDVEWLEPVRVDEPEPEVKEQAGDGQEESSDPASKDGEKPWPEDPGKGKEKSRTAEPDKGREKPRDERTGTDDKEKQIRLDLDI